MEFSLTVAVLLSHLAVHLYVISSERAGAECCD